MATSSPPCPHLHPRAGVRVPALLPGWLPAPASPGTGPIARVFSIHGRMRHSAFQPRTAACPPTVPPMRCCLALPSLGTYGTRDGQREARRSNPQRGKLTQRASRTMWSRRLAPCAIASADPPQQTSNLRNTPPPCVGRKPPGGSAHEPSPRSRLLPSAARLPGGVWGSPSESAPSGFPVSASHPGIGAVLCR